MGALQRTGTHRPIPLDRRRHGRESACAGVGASISRGPGTNATVRTRNACVKSTAGPPQADQAPGQTLRGPQHKVPPRSGRKGTPPTSKGFAQGC